MSKLLVRLEEAKSKFDWQDLIDLLDQFVKEAEKLEKENESLESSIEQNILLNEIKDKKIREMEHALEVLGYRRDIE